MLGTFHSTVKTSCIQMCRCQRKGKIKMRAISFVFSFLFLNFVSGQDVLGVENVEKVEKRINLCSVCACSEISDLESAHFVLNIHCSETDKVERLTDLEKIEWPDNPNGLKISATFEGFALPTLGKLPPNSQIESLRFSNNAIKTYWPDPFSDLPSLKKLSFYQNDLQGVTKDLFTNIHSITDLDLSYNKIAELNAFDFESLDSVKRFNSQSNQLKTIPLKVLQGMSNLEDLDLSKNMIFDLLMRRSQGEKLRGLKRLNLSGNRIRSVIKDSLPQNNSIELLDLSNNIIEMIEEDAFLSCTNLRELNLGQNNITFIFALPPSLQIAILKINTLRRWPAFPSGITYVDMSYNKLSSLYDEANTNFDNLEVLNVGGNEINEINIVKKLPKLFTFDISYNSIEEIPKCISNELFPSLEELHLDGNPIENIYFPNIIALKRLYMNDMGKLTVVGEKAFSNVIGRGEDRANCFSLSLSGCGSLGEIKDGAFAGTSLCMLDVSKNQLTRLSKTLNNWTTITEGVNLQHNPWECSCQMQWVLDELLPAMYKAHSMLLTELRCGSPRAFEGLRLVHFYNWTEQAMCSDAMQRAGPHGNYMLEPSTETPESKVTTITLILGGGIIVSLLIAIALMVYLIKTRRRFRIRQAALKRKRQSAMDAKNSNGTQKEQFSALNKT